ncbi:hypothetical protein VNO78_23182 [Psophocarpus tetragonolobus]|uniref:Uncharacterized protein n=1 Tax=Psophocarpus tetragonolobus TaxID=3891 RepID=A0AAN9XDS2_PSOTE
MQEANYWLCLDSRLWKSSDALVLWQHFLCRNLIFKRAFSPFKRGRDSATCSAWETNVNSTAFQLHIWEGTELIEVDVDDLCGAINVVDTSKVRKAFALSLTS